MFTAILVIAGVIGFYIGVKGIFANNYKQTVTGFIILALCVMVVVPMDYLKNHQHIEAVEQPAITEPAAKPALLPAPKVEVVSEYATDSDDDIYRYILVDGRLALQYGGFRGSVSYVPDTPAPTPPPVALEK